MRIADIVNIHTPRHNWRDTFIVRQERIKREGSQYYTWVYPATAPAVTNSIEIGAQFPRAKKYEPLDFVEVSNSDVCNLTLIINGSYQLPVPAGVMRTVRNKGLWQIGITNDDAAVTTTVNLVIVSLRREPLTIDDWASKQRG